MQIVIDIPKKRYNEIKEQKIITCGETFAKDLVRRIRNGTPLPEHHGRLIDADALVKSDCFWETEYEVTSAPTIIEGSDSE